VRNNLVLATKLLNENKEHGLTDVQWTELTKYLGCSEMYAPEEPEVVLKKFSFPRERGETMHFLERNKYANYSALCGVCESAFISSVWLMSSFCQNKVNPRRLAYSCRA
jgi:hypothetical protein